MGQFVAQSIVCFLQVKAFIVYKLGDIWGLSTVLSKTLKKPCLVGSISYYTIEHEVCPEEDRTKPMRTIIVVYAALALGGSALANNIALSSLGAIAASNVPNPYGSAYQATNAIDGSSALTGGSATQWDAVGYSYTSGEPFLLINLGQLYNVDYLTVTGMGSPSLTTSFNVFVGTGWSGPAISNNTQVTTGSLINPTEVLSVTAQPDGGSGWTISTNALGAYATAPSALPSTAIQYVELVATGTPSAGSQDAAFANEIVVDAIPEPATMGLAGLALLALGCASRLRRIVL